jgi:hypothetical protein
LRGNEPPIHGLKPGDRRDVPRLFIPVYYSVYYSKGTGIFGK